MSILTELKKLQTPLIQDWISSGKALDKVRIATVVATAADVPFIVSKTKIKSTQKIVSLLKKLEDNKTFKFKNNTAANAADTYIQLSTPTYLRFFNHLIEKHGLRPSVDTVAKLKAVAKEEYTGALEELERMVDQPAKSTTTIVNVTNQPKNNKSNNQRTTNQTTKEQTTKEQQIKQNKIMIDASIKVQSNMSQSRKRSRATNNNSNVSNNSSKKKRLITMNYAKSLRKTTQLFGQLFRTSASMVHKTLSLLSPQVLTAVCILYFMYSVRHNIVQISEGAWRVLNQASTFTGQQVLVLASTTRGILTKMLGPDQFLQQCEYERGLIKILSDPSATGMSATEDCLIMKRMYDFVMSGCAKRVGFSQEQMQSIIDDHRTFPETC
jgi:hypothetical protein